MWRRYERSCYFKFCMLEKALDLFYPLEEEEKEDTQESMAARCHKMCTFLRAPPV